MTSLWPSNSPPRYLHKGTHKKIYTKQSAAAFLPTAQLRSTLNVHYSQTDNAMNTHCAWIPKTLLRNQSQNRTHCVTPLIFKSKARWSLRNVSTFRTAEPGGAGAGVQGVERGFREPSGLMGLFRMSVWYRWHRAHMWYHCEVGDIAKCTLWGCAI